MLSIPDALDVPPLEEARPPIPRSRTRSPSDFRGASAHRLSRTEQHLRQSLRTMRRRRQCPCAVSRTPRRNTNRVLTRACMPCAHAGLVLVPLSLRKNCDVSELLHPREFPSEPRLRPGSVTIHCAIAGSISTKVYVPDVIRMLIKRMDRTGRLAAARVTSLPIAIDIAREAEAIIAKAEAARDLRYFEVENMRDDATALIDGFSLVPGGWPQLEELYIYRMDVHLFLPHQIELTPPIYPVLKSLDLTNIPAPIDGPSFFMGLSQLPNLRRLVLWMILFKKGDTPPSILRPLAFRLSHYTYIQKDIQDPNGTPSGWHIPVVAPSKSPKELTLLLRTVEDLTPLLDQPNCLDAVDVLNLSDGSAWPIGKFLPLDAYTGVARRCPRLKALGLSGTSQSILAGLAALLVDNHLPLRSISVEIIPEPTTWEALAKDDRAFAELLGATAALRHLRSFALTTLWEQQGIPGVRFSAIKAQCRSRAVRFAHDAR